MKKNVLFYLVFVLLAMNARAQQNTVVTLGTGTTASQSNGPVVVDAAMPTSYFSRHIALYMAADINATPFPERTLTKIAWYKDDANAYTTTGGAMKIFIKQTTNTSLMPPIGFGANWNNEINGATEVYNIAMPSISSGAGWKEFVLPKPFTWDGTSNLEIFVEWSGTGTISNSLTWRYTAGTGTNAVITTGTGTSNLPVTGNIPNIQLTFSSFNNDGGITSINSPVSPVAVNVSTPVTATFKNFGLNAVTGAVIGWKVNGVTQPDYTWTGNLASNQTDGPITLGNYTFMNGVYTIKAYTKSVNGVADPLNANDTTTVQLTACSALSGTNYTINKNAPVSATNFQSFNSVVQALNTCGVSGAVTITVAPGTGPYNESVVLTNVPGTSATNTLTFEGSGNTITSANEVVFKLNNADYVKLNNLVITNTSTALKSAGLQLINNSDFFTLTNSTINMPQIFGNNILGIALIDGSNFNALGNYTSNSLFQNNIINGGHYSIRMSGQSVAGSTPIGAVNNRFVGNQFRDYNAYGMYFSQADGTKIEGNSFSRPTRVDPGSFVGIQVSTGCINTIIEKNRFHNTHGAANATTVTNGVIGLTIEAAATAGTENTIKNNLFYNFNNHGAVTGINLNSAAAFLNVYNNTFSIENPNRPASNTSNIRVFSGAFGVGANIKIINNIVSMNMPGTGNKYIHYYNPAPPATFVSNNNIMHLASGQTNAYTGGIGPATTTTNYATLANWQAANTTTPYDANGSAIDPAFTNLATGDLKPTAAGANNIGQPLAAVTDDIMGVTRNATTPDPGAYEFDVTDAGVSAVTAPNSGCNLTNQETVTITVNNFGSSAISNVPVSYSINGGLPVNGTVPGPIAPGANTSYSFTTKGNLSAPGSYTILARTNLAGDVLATNDTISKVVVSSAVAAVPTITAGGPVTFCAGDSVTLTAASATAGASFTWFKDGVAITGATAAAYNAKTAGNYTAVAMANGCSSAASAATTVTVNAVAVTPVITAGGATTFCAGDSVILTAASTTTGATYTWELNGTLISGATAATFTAKTAGSYTVIATANGCASPASAATTITVTPLPATPTITRTGLTLTSSNATGNQWYKDNIILTGETNATYNVTSNGSYTVVVTDNGCDSEVSNAVNITNTGVKDAVFAGKVAVYPNPSNGVFNIKLPAAKGITLIVTDLSGKLIREQKASADLNVLDMSGAAKGVYLLKVASPEGTAVRKLIVE